MVPLMCQHRNDRHIGYGMNRVIDILFRARTYPFAQMDELFAFGVVRIFARYKDTGAVDD